LVCHFQEYKTYSLVVAYHMVITKNDNASCFVLLVPSIGQTFYKHMYTFGNQHNPKWVIIIIWRNCNICSHLHIISYLVFPTCAKLNLFILILVQDCTLNMQLIIWHQSWQCPTWHMNSSFTFIVWIFIYTTHTNTWYLLELIQSWISCWHWSHLMHASVALDCGITMTIRLVDLTNFKFFIVHWLWYVKHDVFLPVPSSMTPPHEHFETLIHLASLVPFRFLACIMLLHHPIPPSHGLKQNDFKSISNMKVGIRKKSKMGIKPQRTMLLMI
jgi:hypothetical protein